MAKQYNVYGPVYEPMDIFGFECPVCGGNLTHMNVDDWDDDDDKKIYWSNSSCCIGQHEEDSKEVWDADDESSLGCGFSLTITKDPDDPPEEDED